jgi:hypothetical protein
MESEREYMHRRAGEEQAAAARAGSEKARELHTELAARYRNAAETRLATRQTEPEPAMHGLPLDFRILE